MYGCVICSLAPQPFYRFTHLVVHSASIYSNSAWFSWSFRAASIGPSQSWNSTAPSWWAVKSVTFYKHLDKTFQLQPSERAAEGPVNYFSCEELLKWLILVGFRHVYTSLLLSLLEDTSHATSRVVSGITKELYSAKLALISSSRRKVSFN